MNRQNPCPCCGHADWCGFTSKLALCQRVPSERQAANGAWLHELDREQRPLHLPPGRLYQRVAPVGARHQWYSALARACGLSDEDQEALRRRGLTEETIRRNGYATLPPPSRRGAVVEQLLAEIGADPGHIPGFYRDETGRWCLAGPGGLLCPVRDESFLIQAFQIRRHQGEEDGPRYVWLSSAGDQVLSSGHVIRRFEGTSSGAPLHHHRRPGTPVWITEGPLKADLLHQAYGVSTIALPGVGNWRPLLADPMVAPGRTPCVVLAFDQDPDPAVGRLVARARSDLSVLLHGKGLDVKVAVWDGSRAKGIDDAIQAGLRVHVERCRSPDRADCR